MSENYIANDFNSPLKKNVKRIFFVVDDAIAVLEEKINRADGQGLDALKKVIQDWPDTKSITFLPLPPHVNGAESLIDKMKLLVGEASREDACKVYILLDVFFGLDQVIGPKIYPIIEKSFRDASIHFKIAFMSQANDPEVESLNVPNFIKSEVARAYQEHSQLPHKLLEWLDADQKPPRASIWDAKKWLEIRSLAQQLGSDKGWGRIWGHHLPGGGSQVDRLGYYSDTKVNDFKEFLRLKGIFEADDFPNFSWDEKPIEPKLVEGSEAIYGWDRPPIRAFAQFDSGGKDLSNAFSLAYRSIQDRLGQKIKLHVNVLPGINKLSQDHLWFNVSQVIYGLDKLITGFVGTGTGTGLETENKDGIIVWDINERKISSTEGMFEIQISQYIVPQDIHLISDKHKIPLPRRDSAKNRAKEAYACLEKSGFNISEISKTGKISLLAAIDGDGIWEMKI